MFNVSGKSAAFLLALLSIILLSSNATVSILAAPHIGFFGLSLFCTAITCVGLCLLRATRIRRVAPVLLRDPWFYLAVVLKFLNDLMFYYAVMTSSQIEATVIVYLYPIFNILVGAAILSGKYRRLNLKEWLLVVLSFVSISLLTPLTGLSELAPHVFTIALLSAAASAYVVILQKIADHHDATQADEGAILAAFFLGSLVLHLVAFSAAIISGHFSIESLIGSPGGVWAAGVALIWIGLFVNIGSEALWLRAARLYDSISLKSIFYLSPALGACYMALLGVDKIDEIVLFSLTGVTVCNFILHQERISDVSFVAFLFGLFASAVLLKMSGSSTLLTRFSLSGLAFELLITFVAIFVGFLMARAFEVYQSGSNALTDLIEKSVEHMQHDEIATLEQGFDRLVQYPDVAAWNDKNGEGKCMHDLMCSPPVRGTYLRFLQARTTNSTHSEIYLMFILCGVAIPAILAQAIETGRGHFFAAFAVAVFAFMPVFVVEVSGWRLMRPWVGVLVRRAQYLSHGGTLNRSAPIERYTRNKHAMSRLVLLLTVVCSAAVWVLLDGGAR